jgi:hypothetical protein
MPSIILNKAIGCHTIIEFIDFEASWPCAQRPFVSSDELLRTVPEHRVADPAEGSEMRIINRLEHEFLPYDAPLSISQNGFTFTLDQRTKALLFTIVLPI